jgi:hypothetical protein
MNDITTASKNWCLYSSVVERQSCKLKVLGSIPSGGLLCAFLISSFACKRCASMRRGPLGLMDKASDF